MHGGCHDAAKLLFVFHDYFWVVYESFVFCRYETSQTEDTENTAKIPTSSSEDDANGASIQGDRCSSLLNQQKFEEPADSWNEDSDQDGFGGRTENADKYNELEDSGDEQLASRIRASPKSPAKRRRLRVVMDFDDDD